MVTTIYYGDGKAYYIFSIKIGPIEMWKKAATLPLHMI
jgi:hypothetical protein